MLRIVPNLQWLDNLLIYERGVGAKSLLGENLVWVLTVRIVLRRRIRCDFIAFRCRIGAVAYCGRRLGSCLRVEGMSVSLVSKHRMLAFVRAVLGVSGRTVVLAVGLAVLPMLVGCRGGLHEKGEQRIRVVGSYGEPIRSGIAYNAGRGTGQNAALTIGYDRFVTDRLALMVDGTPYRIYNQDEGDVYTGEFQVGVRYYFWEFDVFGTAGAMYGEMLGGIMLGSNSVPEEGHTFNFTQDTGLGFEFELNERISLNTGYRMKHLSNGGMFNDDNPSQNDHHVYVGVAISW
jgi:opacity protein-like surface antigen